MGDIADYYGLHDLAEELDMSFKTHVPVTPKYEYWETRDRHYIHIKDMTPTHIKHCLCKIEREQWRLDWEAPLLKELARR